LSVSVTGTNKAYDIVNYIIDQKYNKKTNITNIGLFIISLSYKYHDLKNHVNEYATLVQQAFENDQYIWGKRTSSGDFEKDLQNALNWLDARAEHLDSYVNTISVMN
ncbi:MAG: hypothetical protein KA457_10635, partial [Chitinophagales bacterium]|nr:hypothetical protein [Chitinophagales bacterium]